MVKSFCIASGLIVSAVFPGGQDGGSMPVMRTRMRLISVSIAALLCAIIAGAEQPAASKPLLTRRVDPKEFGVQDDTITVVSATSFTPQHLGAGVPSVGYSP